MWWSYQDVIVNIIQKVKNSWTQNQIYYTKPHPEKGHIQLLILFGVCNSRLFSVPWHQKKPKTILPRKPKSRTYTTAADATAGKNLKNSLPFIRFHVLFHWLFSLLFIFRSHYFYAISLLPIFRLRRRITPFRAWFPTNSTLLQGSQFNLHKITNGTITLSGRPFQATWILVQPLDPAWKLISITPQVWWNRLGLHPLLSPILRVSLLIFFPGISKMLQSVPWSDLKAAYDF